MPFIIPLNFESAAGSLISNFFVTKKHLSLTYYE